MDTFYRPTDFWRKIAVFGQESHFFTFRWGANILYTKVYYLYLSARTTPNGALMPFGAEALALACAMRSMVRV